MKASWHGQTIAQSDQTIVIEGNHYFPPESVARDLLRPSDTHSHCSWKGDASYYHLEVDGQRNEDAAWYYPNPLPEAARIKDYLAFWQGIEITE